LALKPLEYCKLLKLTALVKREQIGHKSDSDHELFCRTIIQQLKTNVMLTLLARICRKRDIKTTERYSGYVYSGTPCHNMS
jgi:hypothetical protein